MAALEDDLALLRRYRTDRSDEAFARLVGRNVDLVYTSARRQVGEGELARDVTQAVFMILAQKAAAVPADRPLSAWLLTTTRYCAANARRARVSRQHHERRAAEMARDLQRTNACGGGDGRGAEWAELAPLLDEGLGKLRARDRDAVVLKFFEHKSHREVGEVLGLSEEAAAKRVNRAVERLREFFRRRGVVVASAAGVGAMLAAESVHAAPAGLAHAVSTGGAAAAAAAGAGAGAGGASASPAAAMAKGALATMAMKKTTAAAVAIAVLLAGVGGGAVAMHALTADAPRARTVRVPQDSPAAAGAATTGAVTFADGTSIRIVGMNEVPPAGALSQMGDLLGVGGRPKSRASPAWWGADGATVAAVPLDPRSVVSVGEAPGRRQIRLIFAERGSRVGLNGVNVRVDGAGATAMSSRVINGEPVSNYVVSVPADLARTRIRVGLATGPWREDESFPVATSGPAATRPTGAPIFVKVYEIDGKCTADVNGNKIAGDRERRMVAVLKDGRTVNMSHMTSDGSGRSVSTFNCRKGDVARLVYSSRPYEWAEMADVALKPGLAAATRPAETAERR